MTQTTPQATSKRSIDWQALEAEYVNGHTSYEDFAASHNLRPPTLRKRAERGGWTLKRHEIAQTVTSQAQAKITVSRVDELSAFNLECLDAAKTIRELANELLANDADLTPAGLKTLASSFLIAQRMGMLALGLPTSNSAVTGSIDLRDTPRVSDISPLTDEQLVAIITAATTGQAPPKPLASPTLAA